MAAKEPVVDNTQTWKCVVYHADQHPENQQIPIEITINDAANRKTIMPGQTVELTSEEIQLLQEYCSYETTIYIPHGSGVYESQDPISTVRKQYPDYQVTWDRQVGLICATKKRPRFLVQIQQTV